MKRLLIVCLIVVGALLAFSVIWSWHGFAVMSARDLTCTRMFVTKARILEYARTNGKLPPSLSVLPPRPGKDDSIADAWGREIMYEADSSGTVTLKSLGRDGIMGGSGEDVDIICAFDARDAQGHWSNPLGDWSYNSLKR